MNRAVIFLKKHSLLIILSIFILYGAFLRIYAIEKPSLWIDEGYSINGALAILEHGYPLLDSGKIYRSGIASTYIIAGTLFIGDFDPFNPWQPRVPSVLFGLGTIYISYLLTRRLFSDKLLALVVSGVMAFSYWEITWSREARGYAAAQFFILLAVLFFVRWTEEGKWWKLVISIGSLAFAYLNHGVAMMFMPSIALLIAAFWFLHPERGPKKRDLIIGGITLTLIAFYLKDKILAIKQSGFAWAYLNYLFKNILPATAGSIIGALIGLFDKKRSWNITILVLFTFLPLYIIMEYGPTIQLRYLYPLFPFMTILAFYALRAIINWIPHIPLSAKNISFTIVAIIIYLPLLVFMPRVAYQAEFDSPKPNFDIAYTLIEKSDIKDSIVMSPYANLTEIYLGKKGYWIPISLTGKVFEFKDNIINGNDMYVNAPVVRGQEMMEEIVKDGHGFVVMDEMLRIRIPQLEEYLTTSTSTFKLIFHGGSGLNGIWLYRF